MFIRGAGCGSVAAGWCFKLSEGTGSHEAIRTSSSYSHFHHILLKQHWLPSSIPKCHLQNGVTQNIFSSCHSAPTLLFRICLFDSWCSQRLWTLWDLGVMQNVSSAWGWGTDDLKTPVGHFRSGSPAMPELPCRVSCFQLSTGKSATRGEEQIPIS